MELRNLNRWTLTLATVDALQPDVFILFQTTEGNNCALQYRRGPAYCRAKHLIPKKDVIVKTIRARGGTRLQNADSPWTS